MGIEWKVRLLEGWEAVSKGVNGRFESLVKGQLIPVDNGTWEEGVFVGINWYEKRGLCMLLHLSFWCCVLVFEGDWLVCR